MATPQQQSVSSPEAVVWSVQGQPAGLQAILQLTAAKNLFKSQAATILETQQLADKLTTFWLLKTAHTNVGVMKTFLEQHTYFGLDPEQIIICTTDRQLKSHIIKLDI